MRIDCVLKNGDNCLAVNETIENIEKTRGWGCKTKEAGLGKKRSDYRITIRDLSEEVMNI